jgi:opacity protein-like surface antigen
VKEAIMKAKLFLFSAALVSVAAPALAAEGSASFDSSSVTSGSSGSPNDEQAFLLGGKVGGIVPINGFGPFLVGGIELGYVFPGTGRSMAALLDVSYAVPRTDGSESDARVASGEYTWEVTQKQLTLMPTFMYRFTTLGDLVPFVGIGPRLYFIQTVGEGKSGGETLLETSEQSTRFGLGIPGGVEYALGPGALVGELLLEWGPMDHRITGDTHLGAINILVGYRAYL